MASTMQFEIPHQLGRVEAKRRIEAGIPKLGQHIPGGGQVDAQWPSEDRVKMAITAMGQKIDVELLVEEAAIKAKLAVPLMLSMMAKPIAEFVKTSAEKMLAPPKAP